MLVQKIQRSGYVKCERFLYDIDENDNYGDRWPKVFNFEKIGLVYESPLF